jgi:hypothetical protein
VARKVRLPIIGLTPAARSVLLDHQKAPCCHSRFRIKVPVPAAVRQSGLSASAPFLMEPQHPSRLWVE